MTLPPSLVPTVPGDGVAKGLVILSEAKDLMAIATGVLV